MTSPTIFTRKQVADKLHCHVDMVTRLINRRELVAFKVGAKTWGVTEEAFDDYVRHKQAEQAEAQKKREPVTTAPADGAAPKRPRGRPRLLGSARPPTKVPWRD